MCERLLELFRQPSSDACEKWTNWATAFKPAALLYGHLSPDSGEVLGGAMCRDIGMVPPGGAGAVIRLELPFIDELGVDVNELANALLQVGGGANGVAHLGRIASVIASNLSQHVPGLQGLSQCLEAKVERLKRDKVLCGEHGADAAEITQNNGRPHGHRFHGRFGLGEHEIIFTQDVFGVGNRVANFSSYYIQRNTGLLTGFSYCGQMRVVVGVVAENQRAVGLCW